MVRRHSRADANQTRVAKRNLRLLAGAALLPPPVVAAGSFGTRARQLFSAQRRHQTLVRQRDSIKVPLEKEFKRLRKATDFASEQILRKFRAEGATISGNLNPLPDLTQAPRVNLLSGFQFTPPEGEDRASFANRLIAEISEWQRRINLEHAGLISRLTPEAVNANFRQSARRSQLQDRIALQEQKTSAMRSALPQKVVHDTASIGLPASVAAVLAVAGRKHLAGAAGRLATAQNAVRVSVLLPPAVAAVSALKRSKSLVRASTRLEAEVTSLKPLSAFVKPEDQQTPFLKPYLDKLAEDLAVLLFEKHKTKTNVYIEPNLSPNTIFEGEKGYIKLKTHIQLINQKDVPKVDALHATAAKLLSPFQVELSRQYQLFLNLAEAERELASAHNLVVSRRVFSQSRGIVRQADAIAPTVARDAALSSIPLATVLTAFAAKKLGGGLKRWRQAIKKERERKKAEEIARAEADRRAKEAAEAARARQELLDKTAVGRATIARVLAAYAKKRTTEERTERKRAKAERRRHPGEKVARQQPPPSLPQAFQPPDEKTEKRKPLDKSQLIYHRHIPKNWGRDDFIKAVTKMGFVPERGGRGGSHLFWRRKNPDGSSNRVNIHLQASRWFFAKNLRENGVTLDELNAVINKLEGEGKP